MGTTTKSLTDFSDVPIIQSHIRASAEMLGQKVMLRHIETTDAMMLVLKHLTFDSPLEVLFWLWWNALTVANNFYPYDQIALEHNVEVEAGGERYRLDFVVQLTEYRWRKALDAGVMVWPKLAVEMDGHTFHERTPEQVTKRDSRDRNLLQAGWQVFHYSWTEFTKYPQRCAEEVFDIATATASELYRQYHQDVPSEYRAD